VVFFISLTVNVVCARIIDERALLETKAKARDSHIARLTGKRFPGNWTLFTITDIQVT